MVREGLQQEHSEKKYEGYQCTTNELLMYNNRLYMHDSTDLNHFIMNTFHQRPYVDHPSYHKIITTVRKLYYSPIMKQYIAKYIAKCLECQQVIVEHKHHARLLQPLKIS
jgi:hypothetical protein